MVVGVAFSRCGMVCRTYLVGYSDSVPFSYLAQLLISLKFASTIIKMQLEQWMLGLV